MGIINKCFFSILITVVVISAMVFLSLKPGELATCSSWYCEYWLPYLLPLIGIIALATLWKCVPSDNQQAG